MGMSWIIMRLSTSYLKEMVGRPRLFLVRTVLLKTFLKNWKKNLHSPVKWSRRSFFAKLLPLLFNISSVIKMTQSFFKTIRPLIQKEKGHKTVLF